MQTPLNPISDSEPLSQRRYALYYAPDRDSALDRFGSRWLGRNAWNGEEYPPMIVEPLSSEAILAATSAPRVYGFHATLKPPFRLHPGKSRDELLEALAHFTATTAPFLSTPLILSAAYGFLALVLRDECPSMRGLADACVREFDIFRAPSPEADARRKKAPLSPRQLELLDRWGYPYVMEEWRFHMTLTGSLDAAQQRTFLECLAPEVAPFCKEGFVVEAITLFEQPAPGAPFSITERFPLRG